MLNAFRDVEDQLTSLRLLSGQAEAQGRAVTAARRATQLSDVRYRNGLVSQLELLDARRSELRNRRQELQVRAAQYVATVGGSACGEDGCCVAVVFVRIWLFALVGYALVAIDFVVLVFVR